jgi:hypothetical protein
VIKANACALRSELGRDAREVEFLDMESLASSTRRRSRASPLTFGAGRLGRRSPVTREVQDHESRCG